MARTPPSRVSARKVLLELRLASRKGDRAALSLALDQMRTLAHSPRYWERYLGLLRNPLARLVDLLVIKQGERIAHQKGWKLPRPVPVAERKPKRGGRKPKRRPATPPETSVWRPSRARPPDGSWRARTSAWTSSGRNGRAASSAGSSMPRAPASTPPSPLAPRPPAAVAHCPIWSPSSPRCPRT